MRVTFKLLGRIYKYAALAYVLIFWLVTFGAYFVEDIQDVLAMVGYALALFVVFFIAGTFWFWLIGGVGALIYHKIYLPRREAKKS